MAYEEAVEIPESLISETREVLAHFYDFAYLVRHPLLRRLQGFLGTDSAVAVQKFRRVLLETIEALRPSSEVPSNDPAWRPYAVLHQRYVLGQELSEVERALGLGIRQVQREQRRGIEAVAIALRQRYLSLAEKQKPQRKDDVLRQEILRAAAEQQAFDAGEQLEKALESVKALAERYHVRLCEQQDIVPLPILGSPSLFRQLLVAALSFTVRLPTVDMWTVHMGIQGKGVVFSLTAAATPSLGTELRSVELPEALLVLAEAQGAKILSGMANGSWRLRISLPTVEKQYTVALVEDNRDLIALFSRYLAKHGYRLIGILDSTTAYDRIAEVMPDVILLDVMMREVDGWELLQRLKAAPRLSQIPVAVCSVLDEPELAISLGADAYLRKPVRPTELLECLLHLQISSRSGVAGSW